MTRRDVKAARQRIVNACNGAMRTRSRWFYAEIRPIPYERFMALMRGEGGSITTDCSGLATCTYFRAGLPDPNGMHYNGQGFTGDMLVHLPHISLSQARMGDLAVFGGGTGVHVVVLLQDADEHPDPLCVSHGHPGDPHVAPLSSFEGLGPLTVLRGLPRAHQIVRKRMRPKWRVIGDHDHVIGHVYTTRWLWMARHRRITKVQRHQLHFDRI